MKRKTFQIDIPNPCNEKWEDMSLQEKGRYCQKCDRNIVDFSLKSDRAIATAYQQSDGNLCGRFRLNQLKRDLIIEPKFYHQTRWKTFGLMLSTLLSTGVLNAQTPIPTTPKTTQSDQKLKKIQPTTSDKTPLVIKGQVIDYTSKTPLIAIYIYVEGKIIETLTDENGLFKLMIPSDFPNSFELVFSYTGYLDKKIQINQSTFSQKNEQLLIQLETDIIFEELLIVAGGVAYTRQDRTLYGLIKNKIRRYKENREDRRNSKKLNPSTAKTTPLNQIEVKQSIEKEPIISPRSTKIITKISPNPFSNFIKMDINSPNEVTYQIILTNELGIEMYRTKIQSLKGKNEITIQPPALNNGVYFLSVLENGEVLQTETLIKKND